MKQTTKILLPLGLFMSVVIPITVKSLFLETDFFESDNGSKIDYLQPYKSKPESAISMPKGTLGDDGLELEVTPMPASDVASSAVSKSSSRKSKHLDIPVSDVSTIESEINATSGSAGGDDKIFR